MSLTALVSTQVTNSVRSRGRDYYSRGSVQILDGDKRSVNAQVQGNLLYNVVVKRSGKTLKAWCTCPNCDDNYKLCKHIWATILAAEAQGFLGHDGKWLKLDESLAPDADLDHDEDPEEWDEYRDGWDEPEVISFTRASSKRAPVKAPTPTWKQLLEGVRDQSQGPRGEIWPPGREIIYVVDVETTLKHGLTIEVAYRERKRDGDWSKPKPKSISSVEVSQLPDPIDRQVLALLGGAESERWQGYSYGYYGSSRYTLPAPMQETLLPLICGTGRCRLRLTTGELRELTWDNGEAWEFWLEVARASEAKEYEVTGSLRRGEERLPLSAPAVLVRGGPVVLEDRIARLNDFQAFGWILLLRKHGSFRVPLKQGAELLQELLRQPSLPRLELPEELHFEQVVGTPRPCLKVKSQAQNHYHGNKRLLGELSFDYEGNVVAADSPWRGVFQAEARRLLLRDPAAEQAAAELLRQQGFRATYHNGLELAPRNLPRVVRTLLAAGWHVEAQGKLFRRPGDIHIEVNSGIDWFELRGSVAFGDTVAQLPELLAALKRGDDSVSLGDGTFGILPEEWLKKYGLLAGLGTAENGHLRFRKSQVGLLDALLASQPEATCDAVFTKARDELRRFEGVAPAEPPETFQGQLRSYQRDGLGWFDFLQQFGFGGCLADDMGLGKTVQVLALLEARRQLRARARPADRPGPALVVVPRSLVFNWKQESARFTPELRVLDHTGIGRAMPGPHFQDYDVVLTTYGTLRRDALHFKDVAFDYCILDEAQAIKNAGSESAKAARLLHADHRLVLSGTPVENHLGELWSLFEFLNPGMLGASSVFRLGGAGARNPEPETRVLLAKALRPFILRRTKDQVAKDLPQKLEQTLYCELEPAQRQLYDELRAHYRAVLLDRVERDGLNKVKMQVLEALLRLRQAACHPGLIDKKKGSEPSAKLDVLLPQLAEVREEGHKALVFSQFTSLLALVRQRLDDEGVPYEYLDGRTRDRAAKVEHFQNDPDCKLFLISLKAGGLGLNLTAAEYVFLLDPWWNPAVEAQAVDRAHRIGQTRPVFAYRLIARDTVEEKVLELQQSKRALADAIINADNSLIRDLGREDLEMLLS